MSSRSHQVTVGQRSSSNTPARHQPPAAVIAIRTRSATRTTCTISRTACTRTMCAPSQHRRRHRRGRGPVALARRDIADGGAPGTTCARRRRAAADPSARQGRQPGQHIVAVAGRLANPRPGSRIDALPRHPGGQRRVQACAQFLGDLPGHRRRRSAACAYIVPRPPAHVHQHQRGPAPGHDLPERRIVPQAADVVDDRRALAEGRPRHGRLVVSMDRGTRTRPARRAEDRAGSRRSPRRPARRRPRDASTRRRCR